MRSLAVARCLGHTPFAMVPRTEMSVSMDPAEPTLGASLSLPSQQGNFSLVFHLLAVCLILVAMLGFLIGTLISDRNVSITLLGISGLLGALGLACFGLSGVALYAHPEWVEAGEAERIRRRRITLRDMPLAWRGTTSSWLLLWWRLR